MEKEKEKETTNPSNSINPRKTFSFSSIYEAYLKQILKLAESSGRLLKYKEGPENLHCSQIPRWCSCCWSGDYAFRTTALKLLDILLDLWQFTFLVLSKADTIFGFSKLCFFQNEVYMFIFNTSYQWNLLSSNQKKLYQKEKKDITVLKDNRWSRKGI